MDKGKTLIKDWLALEKYVMDNPNPKYTIYFERFDHEGLETPPHCGWIKPIVETKETEDKYWEHHVYLSTHTFYGEVHEWSTKTLQKFGFNVILDNWDIL